MELNNKLIFVAVLILLVVFFAIWATFGSSEEEGFRSPKVARRRRRVR